MSPTARNFLKNGLGAAAVVVMVASAVAILHEPQTKSLPAVSAPTAPPTIQPATLVRPERATRAADGEVGAAEVAAAIARDVAQFGHGPDEQRKIEQLQLHPSPALREYEALAAPFYRKEEQAQEIRACGIRSDQWYAEFAGRLGDKMRRDGRFDHLSAQFSGAEVRAAEAFHDWTRNTLRKAVIGPNVEKGCRELATYPYVWTIEP